MVKPLHYNQLMQQLNLVDLQYCGLFSSFLARSCHFCVIPCISIQTQQDVWAMGLCGLWCMVSITATLLHHCFGALSNHTSCCHLGGLAEEHKSVLYTDNEALVSVINNQTRCERYIMIYTIYIC